MGDQEQLTTSRLETINGHVYLITRDMDGNIISKEGRDGYTAPPDPLINAARALANLTVPLTSNQRDQLTLLIVKLLLRLATQ